LLLDIRTFADQLEQALNDVANQGYVRFVAWVIKELTASSSAIWEELKSGVNKDVVIISKYG
jgi:hypothetical protein